ncbi:MAG: aminotransferase class V-fold PLP-dependent enzyme, partial [Candidatus Liptonbacteria bacterium]|nr:aminotransferase class V-fold PLP-dependent enzyme [Candidatus Liptonbacteria bacterium]
MRRIYLDYAASTPVDPEVERAMRPYFTKKFGNPGSLHSFGQEAIAAVDLSRERIAKAIGADFREIIFTGSATEANNLALRGCVSSVKRHASGIENPRIVVSAIEHESVLETARDLEKEGVEVVYLPADREGFVDIKKLESSLNERTILVSVMYANNEIGTVQPVAEISRIIHDFRKEIRFASTRFTRPATRSLVLADLPLGGKGKRADHAKSAAGVLDKANFFLSWPLFHTDAAQAFQFLDCNVDELGVDPVRGRSPQGGRSRAFSGAASNGVD